MTTLIAFCIILFAAFHFGRQIGKLKERIEELEEHNNNERDRLAMEADEKEEGE